MRLFLFCDSLRKEGVSLNEPFQHMCSNIWSQLIFVLVSLVSAIPGWMQSQLYMETKGKLSSLSCRLVGNSLENFSFADT